MDATKIALIIQLIGFGVCSLINKSEQDDKTAKVINDYAHVVQSKINNTISEKSEIPVDLSFLDEMVTADFVSKVKNTASDKIRSILKRDKKPATYEDAFRTKSDGTVVVDSEKFYDATLAEFIQYVSENDKELFEKLQCAMATYNKSRACNGLQSMDFFGGGSNG